MSEEIQPGPAGEPRDRRVPPEDEGIRRERERASEPDRERPPRRPPRYEDEDDPDRFRQSSSGGIDQIIPYRNAQALIAYYLGVFSLIPCLGLLLGPAALILGFTGMSYANRHLTAGGKAHAIVGIVLGLLTTLGNIGFLLVGFSGALLSR